MRIWVHIEREKINKKLLEVRVFDELPVISDTSNVLKRNDIDFGGGFEKELA